MTLRSKHVVPIVLAVFILGIGGTMIFNLWQTTSSKVPATYSSGEFAGEYNPADIRGSYSFGDIEEAFAVPVTALAEAFAVVDTENPAAFLCKSLEELYGEEPPGSVSQEVLLDRLETNEELGRQLWTMNWVEWAMIGVGAAALGTALYLYLAAPEEEAPAMVSLSPTRGGLSLSLSGRL